MNNRIRTLREELQMSQIDLAKKFNITSATISQYELGKRFPDQKTLENLADFFDVSVDYLLCRSNIRKLDNETKTSHNLDVSGLPDEAIKQVEDYIDYVKQKYNPDGSLKK
ncbi:MAG: putative transcriptional regulator [Eubacterium sp.]|jgi:transcriptional regulator with XRE-family HTH domain|nr:putative transcriptional regulator [Eubacterium sp.]